MAGAITGYQAIAQEAGRTFGDDGHLTHPMRASAGEAGEFSDKKHDGGGVEEGFGGNDSDLENPSQVRLPPGRLRMYQTTASFVPWFPCRVTPGGLFKVLGVS